MLQNPPNLSPPEEALSSINILGIRVHTLAKQEILQQAQRFLNSDWPHQIITANSLLLLEAHKNPALKETCNSAALVVPESSGIEWAAHNLKQPLPGRYPGIDLAFDLCGLAEISARRVFLLGGQPGVAEEAAKRIANDFPYLAIGGVRDGFFKESDVPNIVKNIIDSRARLILVALGMPKQELWIHEHLAVLPPGVYMGVGGTFDIWSRRLRRAPQWIQRSGLEWLYRLQQEPRRLGRILQLPRFFLKVLTHREGVRSHL